jgi:hypothetical protein
MRRKRHSIDDLRLAIDCLPIDTRRAMLEGVRRNDIVAGAYADRGGGVCPMLAAHRAGARTDFLGFARAWDRFTKTERRARRANGHERKILISQLRASLMAERREELATAIADHEELVRSRPRPAEAVTDTAAMHPTRRGGERPGDADRSRELAGTAGWRWLRPFRRWDEYRRALEHFEAQRDGLEAEAEIERELARH